MNPIWREFGREPLAGADIIRQRCCSHHSKRYFLQESGINPYSPNTLRAQKADGAIFQAFCEQRGESYLPADPVTIRAFIDDRVKARKKPATIKRYVATIARVHIAAKLLNPCSSEAVRLGLKKMGRETSARQDQAYPLGWKEIKGFVETAGEGLRADRERAMLCVAYETLFGGVNSWRCK